MSKNLKILLFIVAAGVVVYFFVGTDSRKDLKDCHKQATQAQDEVLIRAKMENWDQERICRETKRPIQEESRCVQKHYKSSLFSDKGLEDTYKLEVIQIIAGFNRVCPGYKVEVPRF